VARNSAVNMMLVVTKLGKHVERRDTVRVVVAAA
jgi:hypothetical protein